MTWQLTYSGLKFDIADPQPDMIVPTDIAHALANECRFAGHTRYFYSVAQHSVIASQIVATQYALEALLHDASEAYIKDIPRPLKQLLPDYRAIEQKIERAIRARFGLPEVQSDEVSQADRVLLATERRDLMPDEPSDWPILAGVTPLDKRIKAVNNNHAKALFLERLMEVFQG